jgi:hypothetical protein
MYEMLTRGKDLKKCLKDKKHITKLIVPMGSNFDSIEPDMGIIIEERGKTKKGN